MWEVPKTAMPASMGQLPIVSFFFMCLWRVPPQPRRLPICPSSASRFDSGGSPELPNGP